MTRASVIAKVADCLDDELFAYSEWLDKQGLVVSDKVSDDQRSHEQLVADFLGEQSE